MARRLGCHLNQWCSRMCAIELDRRGDPVYFALNPNPPSYSERLGIHDFLDQGKGYSVHVSAGDRIQSARLYCELQNTLASQLPRTCSVWAMHAFQPDVDNSVIKGFFIQDAQDLPHTEGVLQDLVQRHRLDLCSYVPGEDGTQWWQWIWSQPDDKTMRVVHKYCIVAADIPEQHPSVLSIGNSVVFYSFEDAYTVLQECIEVIPESKEVLELADRCLHPKTRGDFPIIVIEGLDATGKTTLTQSLREALEGVLLRSPPACLSQWRARFDAEPPLIRRAFYALGNYITADQIARESMQAPVVVDRYWHSTAAYAIATEVSGKLENLPAPGSAEYRWPSDLLGPDLVVLLTVSPEERLRRFRGRGDDKTREEAELEANNLFRLK
ncbi:CMPK2 kinase, partial [Amia calva]|nr:CMPK2 kinase [Amia calva]